MNFIYPEFLYALLVLALPIIIHLFNFKRFKTIYFPDVSFLKEIKQRSRSTSRIKHLLVLLSRMLLLSCLVLAFAQPYFKEGEEEQKMGKKGVQIYLDNSFSMEALAKRGSLFDEGKQRVYTIINSYSAADRFQLLSNSFESDLSVWLNKEAAIEKIQSIEIDYRNKSLSQIINRFQESDKDEIDQIEMYLISDFQRSNFDLESIDSIQSKLNLVLLDAAGNDNLSLQDLQFEKPFHLPEQTENLQAKVIRHGNSDKVKIPIKLFLGDQLKVPLTIEFDRNDTLLAALNFQSGSKTQQEGRMVIKDYPITYDDTLFFHYSLKNKINVQHIYEEEANRYVTALFSDDSLFEYSMMVPNEINYTELDQASTIILDELSMLSSGTINSFIEYINKGGDLILIPSDKSSETINEFLRKLRTTQLLDLQEGKREVGKLNQNSQIYEGVFESIPKNIDLPMLESQWLISENYDRIKEDLIEFKDGTPLLRKYSIGEGQLYLFTSSLMNENNTMGRHAIFVPTFYNMALYSQEKERLYHYLNAPLIQLDKINAVESPVHIVGKGIDLIPQQEYSNGGLNIRLNNQIKKAGHYQLIREGENLGMISLNYSRDESDFSIVDEVEMEEFIKQGKAVVNTYKEQAEALSQAIKNTEQGKPLWKYFIILALLFMAVEILLLRIFK